MTTTAQTRTGSSTQGWHRAGTSRHVRADYETKRARRESYVYVVPAVSRQIWRGELEIGAIRDVMPMSSERVLLDVEMKSNWTAAEMRGMRLALGRPYLDENAPILPDTAVLPVLAYLGLEPAATTTTSLTHLATLSLEVAKSRVLLRDLDRLREVEGTDMRARASPSSTQLSPVVVEPARLPAWTMGTLAVCPVLIASVLMTMFAGWLPSFIGVAIALMLSALFGTAALQFKAIYRSSHRVVGADRAFVRTSTGG